MEKDSLKVGDIMSKATMTAGMLTVTVSDTVLKASKIMVKQNVSSLIVVKDNSSVGILTERDIVKKIIGTEKQPDKVLVGEIMSSPLETIEYDTSLQEASAYMMRKRIKKLIVTKNNKIIGIITTTDFMRAYDYLREKIFKEARDTVLSSMQSKWE
jgi:CBS domain-containing protein